MARRGLRRLPPFKDYLFRAAVLFSLTFFALTLVIVTYRPPAPNHNQSEQAEADQQNVEGKSFGQRLIEDPTAFFTMVLAGLTLVLASVSSLQIYFLISADRTTRLAARSAVKSAEVAARTVRSIEDTAERQLRAYVGIEKAYISKTPSSGSIEVTVVIRNSGQTPAYNHFPYVSIGYGPRGVTTMSFPDDPRIGANPTTLMPNTTSETILKKTGLSAEDVTLARNNLMLIGVLGVISYVDVFGKTRETNVKMFSRDGANTFAFAEDGNDST